MSQLDRAKRIDAGPAAYGPVPMPRKPRTDWIEEARREMGEERWQQLDREGWQ